MRDAHEDNPYLHDNGIPHARISETVLSNRRARSRSVMVLRNSPSRCDTVQCGPVDDRNLPIWVNHASRQSGSCPILAALLIEVAAGTLDCSAVGLSPRPEQ